MMRLVLRVLLGLSGLIELVLGVSLMIQRAHHPWLAWGGGAAGAPAQALDYLALFLGLACLLAAALHALALRWHIAERDEAYALINVYGGFLLLGGLALYFAFGRLAAQNAPAAWLPLVVDSLRGMLLIVVGNVERISPQTLRRLSLPDRPAQRSPRREEVRDRRPERGDRPRYRGGSRRTTRDGRRASADQGSGRPAAAASRSAAAPPRPAPPRPAPPRLEPPRSAPPRTAEPHAAEPAAASTERRRRRGRRGGARRRSGGRGVNGSPSADGGSEPAPGYDREHEPSLTQEIDRAEETAGVESPDLPDRPRPSDHSDLPDRPRPSDHSDLPDRPRPSDHSDLPDRPRRSDRSDGEGRSRSSDRPRRFERSGGDGPPAGTRSPGSRGGVRIVTPTEIEAGRRPKRGRYSITGALFRPRKKRVRRPLGGDTGREWSWPKEPDRPDAPGLIDEGRPLGPPELSPEASPPVEDLRAAGTRPEDSRVEERSDGQGPAASGSPPDAPLEDEDLPRA